MPSSLADAILGHECMSCAFSLRDMRLRNRLVNASGAFNLHADDPNWQPPSSAARQLGAYVTKTVTLEARVGNPHPRTRWLRDGALVNSVGLANPGISAALETWAPELEALGIPVVVSCTGSDDEIAQIVDEIEDHAPWVQGIELNLSCPNVVDGVSPDATSVYAAVRAARARTARPLLAKLPPVSAEEIVARACAAERAGVDAIVAVNTQPVSTVVNDVHLLGATRGGVSGPPLLPIALARVRALCAHVKVPVIGVGGVSSLRDALRMRARGARIVGVGTALVRDSKTALQKQAVSGEFTCVAYSSGLSIMPPHAPAENAVANSRSLASAAHGRTAQGKPDSHAARRAEEAAQKR